MAVTAHYVTDDTINAFATLGGHLMVYQGLMRRMPGENALANVIGHEIGHVKLRHPVSSMGRGLVILFSPVVPEAGGAEVVSAALGPAGLLAVTTFSRDQERAADAERLGALVRAYRHANGVAPPRRSGGSGTPRATCPGHRPSFSTHPLDDERIAAIESRIRSNGWQANGNIVTYSAVAAKTPEAAMLTNAEHAATSPVN